MKRSTLICAVIMGATGVLGGTAAMAQKPAPAPHAATAQTAPAAHATTPKASAATTHQAPATHKKTSPTHAPKR
ncbi:MULTISPECIES: hypothetical protein [Alcaligenes]|uniref:hypothetical protein n=1 Tax=Alcaligenes TaxID=507 RepID=UPI0012939489|nr:MULTISPECIES: hypothetical protein [Alcaligenes]MBX6964928.1 hypothetical protein [Providencia rettgeri]MBX7031816.1 hypothetical protein [Alcaligenes faecalis]MCR4144456.1 hypothetical protein [Alcaligenes faecalis]